MSTERDIPGDDALLAEGRAILPPLPDREPRVGFAAMVAANAAERRQRSGFGAWLRWSFGGLAVAGAAAAAVLLAMPSQRPQREDLMVAQRLDLFEDMTVVQNQQALEDLDVVEVLHTLEARP
ncbi:MAG: hypothetical protein ACXWLM_13370 [Myxococcales bacterium]